ELAQNDQSLDLSCVAADLSAAQKRDCCSVSPCLSTLCEEIFENLFKLSANFSQRPFYRSFVLDRLTNQQPSQRLLQNFDSPVNTWIENFFATQTQHPLPTDLHQELPEGVSISEARHYSKDFERRASGLSKLLSCAPPEEMLPSALISAEPPLRPQAQQQ
ncbi:hypothetical protein, partial [Inhella proteolytica]